jgi:hypothetical protein
MLKNVIMFIIRVLKLLFMQGKYILPAFIVILLVCSPVAASTSKIKAGAPVFIGETNLDITSAVGDCHVIAWWPDGADRSTPPGMNMTIKTLNDANAQIGHFNISPQIFATRTGSWYCEDKAPFQEVLFVMEPRFTIRAWDVDNDKDISGQTVPVTTNVTYRIDTNLDLAESYANRTNLNPTDTFFTVTMVDPLGRTVTNIYSGNSGAASTDIRTFDSNPFIPAPVYLGKNLDAWNRLSRDARGELLYPPGTYFISASQNLGNMQGAYAAAGIHDLDGRTTGTTSVTFYTPVTLTPAVTRQASVSPGVSTITSPPETQTVTTFPTARPAASKTPYQPLPAWVAIAGLLIALVCYTHSRR